MNTRRPRDDATPTLGPRRRVSRAGKQCITSRYRSDRPAGSRNR